MTRTNDTPTTQNSLNETIRAAEKALYRAYLQARRELVGYEAAVVVPNARCHDTDASPEVIRRHLTASAAIAQTSLRMLFNLQNATITISRVLLDSAVQENRNWFHIAAESVRWGQDTAVTLLSPPSN